MQDGFWFSAKARLAGSNDMPIEVGSMLNRVSDWGRYLESNRDTCDALLDRLPVPKDHVGMSVS